MRILVLGAGGTGGYFGGRMFQVGAQVSFLLRSARAEQLRRDGLRIRSPQGDVTLRPPVVTRETLNGPYDLVILSCKAYDLYSAIEAIRPAVGEQTAILPIMNGLLQYDALDRAFGPSRVLGGLCLINATLGTDGEILHLGSLASLIYGERAGVSRSARCVALEEVLANAAFSSRLSPGIYQDIWEKFVFLTTLAAATCLMRGTVGQICSTMHGMDFMRSVLNESQSVACASGYPVREQAERAAEQLLMDVAQPMTASMLRDLRQGLRVEADHIVGDMVHRARVLNVDTPLLRAAYSHLQVYQAQHD